MTRATDNQLAGVAAAGDAHRLDLAVLAGIGVVGATAAQLVAPYSRRLLLIDDDLVSAGSTCLPSYAPGQIGQAKAKVAEAYFRRRFRHLSGRGRCVGIAADVRSLGGGLWRSASRAGRVVLIAGLDNPPSVQYACHQARAAGIPAVAAQIGPQAAEVMVFPGDRECGCFDCLDISEGEARPCLARREEAPATVTSPGMSGISAGLAVGLAAELVCRRVPRALDLRLAVGTDGDIRTTTAAIPRSSCCASHGAPNQIQVRQCSLTTDHTWAQVAAEVEDSEATLLLDTLPPIATDAPEARLPLHRLGVPRWPILRCELGGRLALLELAGDIGGLGVADLMEGQADDD